MKKSNLVTFINKYYLSGLTNQAVWLIEDNTLIVKFSTEDRVCAGIAKLQDVKLNDNTFGIYTTNELLKMLSVLNDDIELEVIEQQNRLSKLKLFNDKQNKEELSFTYLLTDPDIITTKYPKGINMPSFDAEVIITPEFINKFNKSTSALSESQIVAIQSVGNDIEFIVGYSDVDTNQSRFLIPCDTLTNSVKLLQFQVEKIKNILLNNKDMKVGKLLISNNGLLRMQIVSEIGTSEYIVLQIA